MKSRFASKSTAKIRSSRLGLIVLGTAAMPAAAANLLVNPGFEAPTVDTTPPSAAGWTLQLDCQRSVFHVGENPGGAGGTWNVWLKTFQDAGGGIFQNV